MIYDPVNKKNPPDIDRHTEAESRTKKLLIGLICIMFSVFLFEFLDPAGSIHQLLFSSIKRMAGGTDLDVNLLFHGAELKLFATGAFGLNFMIFRMDIRSHDFHGLQKNFQNGLITAGNNPKQNILQSRQYFLNKKRNYSAAPHLRTIRPPHIARL